MKMSREVRRRPYTVAASTCGCGTKKRRSNPAGEAVIWQDAGVDGAQAAGAAVAHTVRKKQCTPRASLRLLGCLQALRGHASAPDAKGPPTHLRVQQQQEVQVGALLLCALGRPVPLVHHRRFVCQLAAGERRRQRGAEGLALGCAGVARGRHGGQQLAVHHDVGVPPARQVPAGK